MRRTQGRLSTKAGPDGSPPAVFTEPNPRSGQCPYVRLATGEPAHIAVTRADVVRVLSSAAFSLGEVGREYAATGGTLQGEHGLLRLDKPEITEVKRALAPLTTPQEAARYSAAVEGIAEKEAERVRNRIRTDGFTALATGFTSDFIAKATQHAVGLTDDEEFRLTRFSGFTLRLVRDPNVMSAIEQEWRAFYAFCDRLIDKKRQNPDDRLLSRVVARLEEKEITGDKLVQTCASFLNGFSTLNGIMNICIVELLRRPDEVQKCLQDPSRWDATVAELLRSKAHFTFVLPRRAREKVELEGGVIEEGEVVIPALAAALRDRDPKSQKYPEKFNPDQKLKRKLPFGTGPHLCPGEALSRDWLKSGLAALFTANPNLTLDPKDVSWLNGNPPTPLTLSVTTRSSPQSLSQPFLRGIGRKIIRRR